MTKTLQYKTIFTQAEGNQFLCSKDANAFPLLYKMWFLRKGFVPNEMLLYKAYGLPV